MKLYDYEVDSYLGAEPVSISDLQARTNLIRQNLEERSVRGWRFVAALANGKSQSLVFEREARDLEWNVVGINWSDDMLDSSRIYKEYIDEGWFEHSRTGKSVTFFRKKKR